MEFKEDYSEKKTRAHLKEFKWKYEKDPWYFSVDESPSDIHYIARNETKMVIFSHRKSRHGS